MNRIEECVLALAVGWFAGKAMLALWVLAGEPFGYREEPANGSGWCTMDTTYVSGSGMIYRPVFIGHESQPAKVSGDSHVNLVTKKEHEYLTGKAGRP